MTRLWTLTLVGAVALTAASGCKGSLKINAGDAKEEPPPPPPPPPPPAKPTLPKATPKMPTEEGRVHVEGDHLTIDEKIHFGLDSADIQQDSFGLLDEIAKTLNDHQEFGSVSIVGHTDAQGDAGHNKQLSDARAQAVKAALESRGVKQKLTASGAGEEELVCKENTEECHKKNRRVEFKLNKRGG